MMHPQTSHPDSAGSCSNLHGDYSMKDEKVLTLHSTILQALNKGPGYEDMNVCIIANLALLEALTGVLHLSF